MLTRFNMTQAHPVSTPMDPGLLLSKKLSPQTEHEREVMKNIPYMSAVGALMYLAVATRPDIAWTVGRLAQYNSDPGIGHWKAVRHLFRYLIGTMDLRLTYRHDPSPVSAHPFVTYSDSDYKGCLDTGRSTTGFVIKMGTGAVSWTSKKQSLITLSSTEAEFIAASMAGQEMKWLRQLMEELLYKIPKTCPLVLRMDNQSAIAAANNPEHHGRMKQVDVRHLWLRQSIRRKEIETFYTSTQDMTADILTKALPKVLVERHRAGLGLL